MLFLCQDVGHKFLNYLLQEQRFEDAAKLCVKIYGRNKELWESEAYRFSKIGQLRVINARHLESHLVNLLVF